MPPLTERQLHAMFFQMRVTLQSWGFAADDLPVETYLRWGTHPLVSPYRLFHWEGWYNYLDLRCSDSCLAYMRLDKAFLVGVYRKHLDRMPAGWDQSYYRVRVDGNFEWEVAIA